MHCNCISFCNEILITLITDAFTALIAISRSDTVKKVDVEGGATAHIAALKALDLNTPGKNWDMYKNWAESVRTFPAVIKRKVREVQEKDYCWMKTISELASLVEGKTVNYIR